MTNTNVMKSFIKLIKIKSFADVIDVSYDIFKTNNNKM